MLQSLINEARSSREGSSAEVELLMIASELHEAGAVPEVVEGTDPFDAGLGAALKIIENRLTELQLP
ncbi:hypothetical protein ACPA5B_11535 [Pseudomonas solani]|uniref:hypothetical protein n=1 Tax=Pseudomonas solani TaxID=2731552 RepID=UPI003C2F3E8A